MTSDLSSLVKAVAFGVAGLFSCAPALALDSLRIEAFGATEDVATAIERASLLVEAYRAGDRNTTDIMAAARADYARFLGALYGEGYYGGVINILVDGREAASMNPLRPPQEIDAIVVKITPGPQYRFGTARIAPLAYDTELPDEFRTGAPAPSNLIQDTVDAGVEGWRDKGHAKADLSQQRVVADHARRTLSADLALDPGPRLVFGDLLIEGTSGVSQRRIVKIAGLPTGEVFSPADLNRSARRLRDTGVFRSVALLEAEVPNADGSLDITAQIVDQKPRRFGFGAEVATDEGLTLSAFWLHRNLLGGAERLLVEGEVSGIGGDTGGTDYTFDVELGRPATLDAKTDAVLTFGLERLDEEDFTSDTVRFGVGFNREVRDDLEARVGLGYGYSEVDDATGTTTYSQIFLPIGATLDRREDLLNTNDGYYVDLEIMPFYGLSGSESGVRATWDIRAYEDFGADNRYVLAARFQGGSIMGASITGLPNGQRFYSGGGGSVRGQEYQVLDVDLGGGVRSGGRSFMGVQSELRGRVGDNLSLVGFFDWGTVSSDSLPGRGGDSHAGAGIGLRYDTGIGPIRVDLGVPVSGPGDPSGFQLYIGLGQAF